MLKTHLRAQGQPRAILTGTRTAHLFYRRMGYVDAAGLRVQNGLAELRMFKDLPASAHDAPLLAGPVAE